MMKNLWRYFYTIGESNFSSDTDIRVLQLINRLCFFACGVFLLNLFFLLAFQYWVMMIIGAVTLLLVSFTFIFNKQGWLHFAKYYFVLISMCFIFVSSLVIGEGNAIKYFFVVTATAPLLITKNKTPIFIFLLLNMMFFYAVDFIHLYYDPVLNYSDQAISFFHVTDIGILFLLTFFMTYYFKNSNIKYEQRMVDHKQTIEMKNKQIMDSIEYARHIQEAVLPTDDEVQKLLPASFILYQPKDVVSGDFYWVLEKKGIVLFAVIDCTGHGVPGALMSMIGNSLLNEMVLERSILRPGKVLDQLRNDLIYELKQRNQQSSVHDGMDMALCAWDTSSQKLTFAGANNPLYVVRKSTEKTGIEEIANVRYIQKGAHTLYELPANKQPIGYYYGEGVPFQEHEFSLDANDTLYLFSDGYADQFGGAKGKKFMKKRFKKLLLDIQDQPMNHQKQILEQTLLDWRSVNEEEQVDDICVMGVRFEEA